MHPKSFVSNFWGAVQCDVAPLFSVLYIVGYYLLLYGRTNNVVKRRAALCFAACQSKKVLPAWFASVDADIRIGRRRCYFL